MQLTAMCLRGAEQLLSPSNPTLETVKTDLEAAYQYEPLPATVHTKNGEWDAEATVRAHFFNPAVHPFLADTYSTKQTAGKA